MIIGVTNVVNTPGVYIIVVMRKGRRKVVERRGGKKGWGRDL
jgi:hypothetical protein